MINRRLQATPVSGYYEYLSRIRQRVNVAPHEEADSGETMTETTATASSPADYSQGQLVGLKDKDVIQWSSAEVQHWIEEQCQKFELTKATTEKFQMNGQALVLLNKHDFLRRSPNGGEILYYALQRLINPNQGNSVRAGQPVIRRGAWRENNRIVEVDSDNDQDRSASGSSPSAKPIIEEPDDPPLDRQPDSNANFSTSRHQYYPHSFMHNHSHIQPTMFNMPNAAYYQQQQAFPNAFVYAHHHHSPHHHVHAHMSQQQYFHPQSHAHFIHQYHPMMSAHGIVIEVLDQDEANNPTVNGINDGASSNTPEQLYLITVNGQRHVMNEEQIRQYVAQIQYQQQQYIHQQRQQSQDNTFSTL